MELAEEFLERYRQGQRPSLKDYVDRHPELEGEIREVFPAMAMMENIAIHDDSLAGDSTEAPDTPARKLPLPEHVGDFRIIREIGHGGMGVVYEAEQVSLGRHVALKMLPPQMVRDRKQLLRFEREAKAAARLHHSNIVPVFGVGEHDGAAYYVMQFIQGLGLDAVIEELKTVRARGLGSSSYPPLPSLRETGRDVTVADMARSLLTGQFLPVRLGGSSLDGQPATTVPATLSAGSAALTDSQSSGSMIDRAPEASVSGSSSSVVLPGTSTGDGSSRARRATYWQSVARVGVQVAEALDYAHKQGILHRDVKPSNLLLDTRGTVWVTDFGLAKADDHQNLTHTGDILGTLRYMPPEAFDGKFDARGDVYSLGLSLYELLALRPAFAEKDRGKLISQVTRTEPVRLAKLNKEVPSDLDTIVHKAIERDPDHRYGSSGELAADLQRFLDDEPIQARPLSALERLARWRRRNKGLAAALAIAALALIAGTIASGLMAIRANRYADQAERLAIGAIRAESEARHSARAEAESARNARAESARQAAARGLALIDQKDSARGMLWLTRALELDPEDASGIHHAVRVNLRQTADAQLATPRLTLRPADLKLVKPGEASDERVVSLAFSLDGRLLATAHWETGQIRLWSTAGGRELGPPLDHKPAHPYHLAFSPDGRQLWVACWTRKTQELRSWGLTSRLPAGTQLALPGPVAAFRPDGRAVAVQLGPTSAQVLDRQTGKPLGPVLNNPMLRSGYPPAVFSPDGRALAVAESNDSEAGASRAALAWDVARGTLRFATGKHDGYHIYAIAWSPDGQTLATGGHDQVLRLWDTATGALKGLPRRLGSHVAILEFSPDGRTLAVGLCSRINAVHSRSSVQILNSRTGLPTGPDWSFQTGLWSLSFSPDGDCVAVGLSDGTTQLWALPAESTLGKPLDVLTTCAGLDVTPGGRMALGTGSGEVRLGDPSTGRMSVLARAKDRGIWSLVFAPDGKTLAVGTGIVITTSGGPHIAEVLIYDTEREAPICPPIQLGELRAYVYRFNKAGTILYTRAQDENTLLIRTLRLWDARTGRNLGRDLAGDPETTDVAVSLDDAVVFQSDSRGRMTRRSMESGSPLGEPWLLQPQGINRLLIGPDGRSFVTCARDGTVQIWDIETGRPLGPPIEQESLISALTAVSPDGRTVATATAAGSIRLWDLGTGLPLGPPHVQAGHYINRLQFFPAGDRLAIALDPGVFVMPIPGEISGDLQEVRHWAEARAGWIVAPAGTVARLSAADWARRREEFAQTGGTAGPSEAGPSDERDRHLAIALTSRLEHDDFAAVWHLDRVLAGGSDELGPWLERAAAHAELKHEELALKDLETAIALDPRSPAEWVALLKVLSDMPETDRVITFQFQALERWASTGTHLDSVTARVLAELAWRCGSSQRWDLASSILGEGVAEVETAENYELDHYSMVDKYAIALLRSGDLARYRTFCSGVFARVTAGKLRMNLLDFLWTCLLAPDAVGDPRALVRLAESTLKTQPDGPGKGHLLRVVAAALYRAGRIDESISRFEESIKMRGGQSRARDWVFLAMAHARKGHRAQAVEWLKRLASYKPPESPDRLWEEQRMIIHSQEAEAVVIYDPVFPSDPFAP
jgi:serine/threonine protein kinase/WD40 repeat protein/Tfp pilus assembly protein PilF